MRYIIEGEWTGYRSSQQHVCHREVYKSNKKVSKYIEAVKRIFSIPFSDGTSLLLSVREAKPREKVQEKLGYTTLIRDAVYKEMDKISGAAAPAKATKERE